MPDAVYCLIIYFSIGLVLAVATGTWSRLSLPNLEWNEIDLLTCFLMWIMWPILAPCLIIISAATYIEYEADNSNFLKRLWNKLPEASELRPVEWFFSWPAKIYLIIRKHGKKKNVKSCS